MKNRENDIIEMEEIRPGYFMAQHEVKKHTTRHGILRISASEWNERFFIKSETYERSGFKDRLVWTNNAS